MDLEIVYTSGDYKEKLMSEGNDEYCVDGLTAVCFKDAEGNATVIYRGTDGYTAWSENAQAACEVDTPYQQKALNFFESIPGLTEFNDIQLSGHSKGGNMVQYVTIVSAYSYLISHTVSYDGQGFSDLFMDAYEVLIAQNKDKIVSYSAEYDVVNALLYQLDIPRYYLESSIIDIDPFAHHYPDVIFDEDGNLNDYTNESEIRKQVNAIIQYTIEYLNIEYDDEIIKQDVYNVGEILAGAMVGDLEMSRLLDNGTLYHLLDTGVLELVVKSLDVVLVDWVIGSGCDKLEEVAEDFLCEYIDDDVASFIAEHGSANDEWLSATNDNGGVIDAGDGDDGLNGGNGSDKLYGGAGTDNLYGNDGDDILDGGTGTDGLNGGNGTDTYIFAKGYGNDTVNEWGSDITVIKLNDINSDEVTLNSQSENNLVISVNGTSDTLTISNYRWSQGSFTLEFADDAVAAVNKETWEMEYSQNPTDVTESVVSEEELVQSNAGLLAEMYADDTVATELITETDNTIISDVTESTTVADETNEVAVQTDLQVMILTENMSAFADEDNVSDGINVADASTDVTVMSQLLVNSAV